MRQFVAATRFVNVLAMSIVVGAVLAPVSRAQDPKAPPSVPPKEADQGAKPRQEDAPPPAAPIDLDEWTKVGLAVIVEHQEGDARQEWPYEGVYREQGEIPFGYRIGGTAICAATLLELPGYAEDTARQAAVARATKFIVEGVGRKVEMGTEFESTYDVRGWGHAYAIAFLVELEARGQVPKELEAAAKEAIKTSIRILEALEIPGDGGWNYARPRGFKSAGPTSPFMTSATLLALYTAKSHGYSVNPEVIERALDALENARTGIQTYVYSGKGKGVTGNRAAPQGNCARAASAELVLNLAGRSNVDALRLAVDQFIDHWEWLEKRRAQTGTHVPPFGVAPYYFYFGHEQAALAVELLPEAERAAKRQRIHELVARTRSEAGTWNDRVFPRSANFGTAMALRALHAASLPVLQRYQRAEK